MTEVPVLVCGGGPVGLTTSLLVERHPGTSTHPRARGLNVRTMELLRTWGLEQDVEAALLAAARTLGLADVRFGHKLLGMRQTASGVEAAIRELASGRGLTVRASYLVGADGISEPGPLPPRHPP